MSQTHPFPEPSSPELERYMVYARVEILALLHALVQCKPLTTVYFDGNSHFAVTTVLAVNPEFEELIVDFPSDQLAQKRMLASEELTFVAFMESIKLQFVTSKAQATTFEGHPALRVRLPNEALRLQRRDAFRVRTPVSKPAYCRVPHLIDGQPSEQFEKLRMLDISIGGMSLLTHPDKLDLQQAQLFEECYLDLPGIGSLSVSMRVRHVERMPRDESARRCGCEFVNLAPQARLLVQRYVNQVDSEARKLASRAA